MCIAVLDEHNYHRYQLISVPRCAIVKNVKHLSESALSEQELEVITKASVRLRNNCELINESVIPD